MSLRIISRARVHNYRLHTVEVWIPHLPAAYDGFKVGQVSDMHLGSFKGGDAVKRGIEILMSGDPDLVVFTGDLVNYRAGEAREHFGTLAGIEAPYGIFSILGNHDYGEYVRWPSPAEKARNFSIMKQIHKELGWNENRMVQKDGDPLAIIGVENWGRGKFMKYGNLEKACRGTGSASVKILLTHDPTHWEDRIVGKYPGIDLTFAGHTHGFQFGIETGRFKWSPSQYRYKYWAGLYYENGQYLYVNRGFGYLHFTGRVGILPEVTIVILRKGRLGVKPKRTKGKRKKTVSVKKGEKR